MIPTFFLTIAYNAYSFAISLLPTGTISASITTSLTTLVSYMYKFNAVLPIDTLFSVLASLVVFEIAVLVFRLIVWVWARIPFVGSGT